MLFGIATLVYLRRRRYRLATLLFLPTAFPLLIALTFARYDDSWHYVDAHSAVSAQDVVGTWRGRGGEVTFSDDGGALTGDGARWRWMQQKHSDNVFVMHSIDMHIPDRCWIGMYRRGELFLLPVECFADPDEWFLPGAYARVH
jgi:hypothetical protein